MKIVAWVVLGIVIAILLALVYYLLVGAILFKVVFSHKSLSSRVLRKDTERRIKENKIDLCWWDKVKCEKVTTKSHDGLVLAGQYIEANSDKTAIVVHGFGGSYQEMQPYCKLFFDRNFNVLAVDCRAHGASEGNCIGFGWLDRLDILSWIEFMNEKTPNSKIVLFGLSMGGAAVCMAAGEKGLENVVAVISDCAFDNADRQVEYLLKKHKILKIFKKHLYSYAKRLYGFDIKDADAIKQVKKTAVPILFIHGDADNFVPVENLKNLYSATPTALRDRFIVEDAGHALSYAQAGVLYEKKISDFLKSRTPLK